MSELSREGIPGASQSKETLSRAVWGSWGQLGCVCQKDLARPETTLLRGEVEEGHRQTETERQRVGDREREPGRR